MQKDGMIPNLEKKSESYKSPNRKTDFSNRKSEVEATTINLKTNEQLATSKSCRGFSHQGVLGFFIGYCFLKLLSQTSLLSFDVVTSDDGPV